ncbi:MAG: sel1 repeat family protein [Oscillospiraceae bacterium]|nr:sel1 repeat family protein [Oscillospiraceae bacterium]
MGYYRPCPELDECRRLIREYFETEQFEKCFQGHYPLAEKGYPLAECQVGYFYLDGLGVEKDEGKAFYWTKRAAEHGDRDGQYNLAEFYREGVGTEPDMEKAKYWYLCAAKQEHDLAIEKCGELHLERKNEESGGAGGNGYRRDACQAGMRNRR